VERHGDGLLELARDAERAHEVAAGAARDQGEVDVQTGEAVGDLVDRPVAADGDDQVGVRRRLASELGQVSRPLGEERVAVQAERGRLVGELRPASSRRAVLGRRVDEEDGVNGLA
jgi:hypothetical protein